MSKKMLKRSLALGALMAFVITGQVWAAGINYVTSTERKALVTYDDPTGNTLKEADVVTHTVSLNGNNIVIKAEDSNKEIYIGDIKQNDEYYKGFNTTSEPLSKTDENHNIFAVVNHGEVIGTGEETITLSGNGEGEHIKALSAYSKTTVSNVKTIKIEGKAANHIYAIDKGEIELKDIDSIEGSTTGRVFQVGTGGNIKVEANKINIEDSYRAVNASNGTIDLNTVESINLKSTGKNPTVEASDGAIVSLNSPNVNITSSYDNGNAYAVKATNNSDVTLNGDTTITATSTGGRATGINLENSSEMTVDGTLNITAEGGGVSDNVGAQGIRLAYSTATFNDDVTIVATATNENAVAHGLNILADSEMQASSAIFEGNVKVVVDSAYRTYGAYVSGNASNGAEFKGEKLEIISNSSGKEAVGIMAAYGSKVAASSNTDTKIKVTAENGYTVGVWNAYNPDNNQVAKDIELLGNVEIIAKGESADSSYAVYHMANDSGECGDTTIGSIDKKVVIEGNIVASGGNVNTTLGTANSYLTGAVNTTGNATTTLNMVEGATWDASNTGANTLTNLTGKGTLVVGAKDTVNVVNTLSENITVAASVALAEKFAEDGEVTEDEVATLKDNLTNGNKDVVATYQVGETALTGVTTLSADGKYVSNVNTSNLGIRDMAGLALVAWRAENNDMNKRLGELRNAEGEHGVWVRMVRGESEYSTVKNQYNTYQLGYDEKLSVDPSWTVGMALSYTDGESSFAKGSGENNSKGVAVYGSKLNSDGSFVDLIAKYARIENEFDVLGGVGGAEYETNGYSVSAEYGKRYAQSNGMWIEPQVELTYGKVSAVDYVTKNSYKVSQDGMESLVGRVGFSLGKDVKGGNVYARASYLYDFDGETELTFADKVKMDQDLGGGWWEVGVGANINLSKATYIYADVEKTFGGEVDTNWQWNLGVRYSF